MCAAALLRRGGEGCGVQGVSGGRLCAAASAAPRGWCSAGAAAPLRCRAALPPPLPAAGPRPLGSHASRQGSERLWLCGGRGVGWGGRIRLRHTPPTPTRPPPSLTRVCGSAAASRQSKRTALHQAAMAGQTSCVQSLVEAKADVCLKSLVSDDAEIGVGGRGEGCGARVVIKWGGDAYPCPCPCAVMQVPRRLSARAAQPLPSPPGAGASPPPPPPLPVAEWQGRNGLGQAQPHDNHFPGVQKELNPPAPDPAPRLASPRARAPPPDSCDALRADGCARSWSGVFALRRSRATSPTSSPSSRRRTW